MGRYVWMAKLHPRIFRRSARDLYVAPERVLFGDDSLEHDAPRASGAGMRGVWLDRKASGMRPEGVAAIASLGELPLLVDKL